MIDIVLPVHNALDYLKACIATVYEHTKDFRLIIVDDYSLEANVAAYVDWILQKDPNNLLVRTNKQKWFTRASNIGLRLTRGENVILLNSDCVVNEGWVEELLGCREQYLSDNPGRKLGLVGAVLDMASPYRYQESFEPNYVTGHCLLLNREAMDTLAYSRGTPGIWFNEKDPSQIHINSDRIMCYDLNRIGFATIAAFKAPVGHHGGKSWHYDLGAVSLLRLTDVD